MLGRAGVEKCVHGGNAIAGAKPAQRAYAKTASRNLLGPFGAVSLLELGPFRGPCWVLAPPGVFDSLRSPWGRAAAAGGVRGRRAAGIQALFCWRHFLVRTLERLSERLCRGGCRGACAARRGAAYPFGAGG